MASLKFYFDEGFTMRRFIFAVPLLGALFFPFAAHAATCYGSDPCRACHTCGYCRHCAVLGGTCGVCGGGGRRVDLFRINGHLIQIESGDPTKAQRICVIDGSGE
jgi:hypothetical protein